MVSNVRFSWWGLVSITIMLSFFVSPVFAQSYPDLIAARNACVPNFQSKMNAASAYCSSLSGITSCTATTPLFDCQTVYPSTSPNWSSELRNKVYVTVFNSSTGQTSYRVFLSGTGSGNAASADIATNSTYGVNRYFFNAEVVDQCSDKPDFVSSTLRSPSPNGSGSVCHQSCVYNVFVSYIGTYPSGRLEFDFQSLNKQCTNEPDAVTENSNPDDPLDLPDYADPKTPDPGDGTDKSSGGENCSSPPQCSGNSVQCNILYQTWAGRCRNTEGEDGEGNYPPGQGGEGGGEGTDVSGIEERLDKIDQNMLDMWRGSDNIGPGSDENFGGLIGQRTLSSNDLNKSGFSFSRSCNFFEDYDFSVGGATFVIPMQSSGFACNIFIWTGYLVLAFAAFYACVILIRD